MFLAVSNPRLGDVILRKMGVARSEKQTERLEHKLITMCKLGLSNGSTLTRTERRETAFYYR